MSLLFVQPVQPTGQGERLLLAAILRRSAYDIALYRGSSRLDRCSIWRDAYAWMMSDDDNGLTSFISICTLLDQDPATIRKKTLELTRKDVKRYAMVDAHGRF